MFTAEQLAKKFKSYDADEADVTDLLAIQTKGQEHGLAGLYPEAEWSTESADWYTDVGIEIEQIEDALPLPEGAALRIYAHAHLIGSRARREQEKSAKRGPLVGNVKPGDLGGNLSPRHHAKQGRLKRVTNNGAVGAAGRTCGATP
jgi:hypothetical protein